MSGSCPGRPNGYYGVACTGVPVGVGVEQKD